MLVVWPRPVLVRGASGVPVVTLLVMLMAGALRLAGANAATLPDSLEFMVTLVASARLYSDPSQALFEPWQAWSWILVHDTWWGLGLGLTVFWVFAGGLERRLGSALFCLALVVFAPMTIALHLVSGVAVPDLGLVPVAAACAGAVFALAPRAGVRWELWWWMIWLVGRRRFETPMTWLLGVVLGLEALRLAGLRGGGLGGVSSTFFPLYAVALVVAMLVGQFLGRSLGDLRDQALMGPLVKVAAGDGSLDSVPDLLTRVERPGLSTVVDLGQRALREGHRPAAVAVLQVLAQRDPDGITAQQLRAFVDTLASRSG